MEHFSTESYCISYLLRETATEVLEVTPVLGMDVLVAKIPTAALFGDRIISVAY